MPGGIGARVKAALPPGLRRWLGAGLRIVRRGTSGPGGPFANMRRLTPISRRFGSDRGLPIDRHWIDGFLQEQAGCIRGRVLEFGDDRYTCRFGSGRVDFGDVLHPTEGRPGVTIVADLVDGEGIPSEAFDCIICTHTLQYIYEVSRAMATLHRALKPGGALLMTVPGISPVCRIEEERWGEYWRFTTGSVRRLLEEVFPASAVTVKGYGNVLAAIAFLHGLAAEELQEDELGYCDPDYELVVVARATKPAE